MATAEEVLEVVKAGWRDKQTATQAVAVGEKWLDEHDDNDCAACALAGEVSRLKRAIGRMALWTERDGE